MNNKYRVVKEFWYRADSGEAKYRYDVEELLEVGWFKKRDEWYPVMKRISGMEGSYSRQISFEEEEKAIAYAKYLEAGTEERSVVYESNERTAQNS